MLGLGHTHREAVLVMYLWSGVFAFGAVALLIFQFRYVAFSLLAAFTVMLFITFWPLIRTHLAKRASRKGTAP
jgi:UDP-GlcNAc:undecaprenyl-phosphate GlcNAc-1-phosphate transferase